MKIMKCCYDGSCNDIFYYFLCKIILCNKFNNKRCNNRDIENNWPVSDSNIVKKNKEVYVQTGTVSFGCINLNKCNLSPERNEDVHKSNSSDKIVSNGINNDDEEALSIVEHLFENEVNKNKVRMLTLIIYVNIYSIYIYYEFYNKLDFVKIEISLAI